jgi:hypothetical protein
MTSAPASCQPVTSRHGSRSRAHRCPAICRSSRVQDSSRNAETPTGSCTPWPRTGWRHALAGSCQRCALSKSCCAIAGPGRRQRTHREHETTRSRTGVGARRPVCGLHPWCHLRDRSRGIRRFLYRRNGHGGVAGLIAGGVAGALSGLIIGTLNGAVLSALTQMHLCHPARRGGVRCQATLATMVTTGIGGFIAQVTILGLTGGHVPLGTDGLVVVYLPLAAYICTGVALSQVLPPANTKPN